MTVSVSTPEGTTQHTRGDNLRRGDRDARVLALALAGATVRTIAAQVGLGKTQAARIIRRELHHLAGKRAEDLDELRTLEAGRLDRLQVTVWPAALAGRSDALTSVLRIMERRARLLGLDAPSSTNSTRGAAAGPPYLIHVLGWDEPPDAPSVPMTTRLDVS